MAEKQSNWLSWGIPLGLTALGYITPQVLPARIMALPLLSRLLSGARFLGKWGLITKGTQTLLGGGGGKEQNTFPAIPPPSSQITKEDFEAMKERIRASLGQPQPSYYSFEEPNYLGQPNYFEQALALPNTFLNVYTTKAQELGKVTRRQASQLRELASAIPLVSQTGIGYWNKALINSLENKISSLMAQAIPTDMTWDTLLRAKYARRTLQSLLPAYTRLVSATCQSITPSPVVPNLLTSAMGLETTPQTTMLSALPSFYEQKQRALLGAGRAQAEAERAQTKQKMDIYNTLLRNQATLASSALRMLGQLNVFDPTIRTLALRYLQPTTGALQW